MKAIAWLEERTGFGRLARSILYEQIPGGARWRNVWGSTVVFAIGVQFITGLFLWMNYSPGAQCAWESVHHIQSGMSGGSLLRGLHHFTAQSITVLLALHLLQMVIYGAYKAPREVNFWISLALIQCVLLMALTGYQLPWDQKGFWATKVAVSLIGLVPVFGEGLQRVLIGGADYGHLTLTRFFALHAGVIPAVIIALLALRIYFRRRHGYPGGSSNEGKSAPFWPDQALRNAVVCLAFMATMLFLAMRFGAPLGPPADPSETFNSARPEWSFLFMFQFLKQFPGRWEIWGAIIIPGIVVLVLFLMPFIASLRRGHRFNVAFLCVVMGGAALLTLWAMVEDSGNAQYQSGVKEAARDGARVHELAQLKGIPAGGALTLLKHDSLTQGPKLFARNCASCHRFDGHDGTGKMVTNIQSASDLVGFGTRKWLEGVLDPNRVSSTNYFGGTKFTDGKMARFVKKDVTNYSAEEKEQLRKVLAAISAEAGLKSQAALDAADVAIINEGRTLISEALSCTDCHQFRAKDDTATAPDLTGYASREWLVQFVGNPGHARFYGERNDRMPAYTEKQTLDPESIGMIVDWLRGDWPEAAK